MIEGLEKINGTKLLNKENCRFALSSTGLLTVKLTDGTYEGRAFLARAFPFQLEEEYISLQNGEKEELGMIRRLTDLKEEDRGLVREELKKKYFAPKIQKILVLTERFGSTHWDVETDVGKLHFTVKDTYRSIIRMTEDRLYVCDVDGCRYEIPSLKGLDRRSFSKIELYV